jgi:hypothetical protein
LIRGRLPPLSQEATTRPRLAKKYGRSSEMREAVPVAACGKVSVRCRDGLATRAGTG